MPFRDLLFCYRSIRHMPYEIDRNNRLSSSCDERMKIEWKRRNRNDAIFDPGNRALVLITLQHILFFLRFEKKWLCCLPKAHLTSIENDFSVFAKSIPFVRLFRSFYSALSHHFVVVIGLWFCHHFDCFCSFLLQRALCDVNKLGRWKSTDIHSLYESSAEQ